MIKVEIISSDGSDIYTHTFDEDYESFKDYINSEVVADETDGDFIDDTSFSYRHNEGCCLIRQID